MKKPRIKTDKQIVDKLIEEYLDDGGNIQRLANKYHYSPNTIKWILVTNNVPMKTRGESRREYSADYSYFDKIDTFEKAYWLGFIGADGSCDGKRLFVRLSVKDEEHLYLFKSHLKSEHPIVREERTEKVGFSPAGNVISKFCIGSEQIGNALKKIGINGDKTKYSRLPILKEEFYSHFIRGYFDGDGCITYKVKETAKVTIASNKYILQDMIDKVKELIGIEFKLREKNDSDICYTMDIYHRDDIRKFMNWIYNDREKAYLIRKYEKYLAFDKEYAK